MKWRHVGSQITSKIDVNLEKRFFEETMFFMYGKTKHAFKNANIEDKATSRCALILRNLQIDIALVGRNIVVIALELRLFF